MYPIKPFNVVFDIDDVLAVTRASNANEVKFYGEKGFILTAIKTHYIFPGVIEMMQLLFRMPDVRISFYSSCHQNRDELFVEKLLERSLGKEHYLQIRGDVKILSGKKDNGTSDLDRSTSIDIQLQKNKFGLLSGGGNKKSLEKILGSNENLENCVLIDDQSSFIKYGQESNYLFAHTSIGCFDRMQQEAKYYSYDEHGQKKIPLFDRTYSRADDRADESLKDQVICANEIAIMFEKEKCTLGYVDLNQKQYEEMEITQESNEDIFKAVKKHYQYRKSEESIDNTSTMSKDELDLILYRLIEEKGGKTRSINLPCNSICYVAGLLFKALEFARSGSTLTKFLFPIHFSKKANSDDFEPLFSSIRVSAACHKKEEYYHYGLEKLKEANPNFTFINPQIYQECCEKERSNEELDLVQKIYQNQDECILM